MNLEAAFLRLVAFGETERRRLLRIITTQLRAGLPLGQIFRSLEEYGHSPAIRRLGRQSQRDQVETGLFTGHWDSSGLWPRRDALLLQVAERQGALPEVTEILEAGSSEKVSWWKVVGQPNMIWAGSALMTVAILLGTMTQADLIRMYSTEEPRALMYGTFVQQWGPALLLIGAGVTVVYRIMRRRLGWPLRGLCHKAGMFLAADRLYAARICRLLTTLFSLGLSWSESMNIARKLEAGNPYHRDIFGRVQGALDRGEGVAEALRYAHLLDLRYANYLRSLAPEGDTDSLCVGLPLVADLLELDVASALEDIRYFVTAASLAITGLIIFALLPLAFGEGLNLGGEPV